MSATPKNLDNSIRQVADLLRGEYKRADYGKVPSASPTVYDSACVTGGMAIARQLGLLAERKRALITAAVKGQRDVTTARGVDVS